MKILTRFSVFFLFIISGINNEILAQACAGGTATETLDAANSKITLSSSGIWAYDPEGITPAYQWPRPTNPEGCDPGLIFTGNLWMGGFDPGGNFKMSAKLYGRDDNNGYWPGPLQEDGTTTNENCENWDRLFKVSKVEIENLRADFADNQQINNPIPESILGWPGVNNSMFSVIYGFELPETSSGLAPFYDNNIDGIYNPYDGDYPEINCADQAVWWVFNDVGNLGHLSVAPVKMEIQMMAYVYDSNLSNIYNSSFYDVKLKYYGSEPLDSFYMALWIDPDLGCPYDDYVGTVPEEELTFVYNADALDGINDSTACEDIATYNNEPPMFGIKLLRGPLGSFGDELGINSSIFYNGLSSTPGSEPPIIEGEYYNVMNGQRSDGGSFVDQEGMPTRFLYDGNPATLDEWSMCSEMTPLRDNRIVIGIGPMRILPTWTNELTFAVIVQPQPTLPCPDVSALIAAADIQAPGSSFDSFYCDLTTNTSENFEEQITLSVFPNPATDQLNFQLSETESFASIRLYRMDGQLVRKVENIGSSSAVLKRKELATGTYVYQIQTQSGDSVSGKIIFE